MDPFRTSPLINARRAGAKRFQRPVYVVSVCIHAVALAILFALHPTRPPEEEDLGPIDVVFYSPLPEEEPIEPPVLPDPVPPPRKPEIKPPEPPPKPEPKAVEMAPVPVAPEPEPARVEPPPLPPPPAPEKPKPKPEVKTQVFGEDAPAPPAPVAKRAPARTGDFGTSTAPVERAARTSGAVSKVGGFEVVAEARPAGVPGPSVVTSSGFGEDAPVTGPSRAGTRTGNVATAGFGTATPGTGTGTRRARGPVTAGGFNTHSMEASKGRPRQERKSVDFDTAVEIVSKPKPSYTDEARKMRIEGEVVLEVTFVASGRMLVHRVVSPLGHGLDEAAIEAAKNIQFTPARRNGVAVDHTATLRVVFRLA